MTELELKKLKYPIGGFKKPKIIDEAVIETWISVIENFPNALQKAVRPLTIQQLNWTYRPGGWTIKQVVHHCADSHMNSLIRFKLGLTEDNPEIRPYFEDRWAELPDSLDADLDDTILLLKGLHRKWVKVLRSMTKEELKRGFVHPEHGKRLTLEENIGIYAWHCNHHLAHIKQALVLNSI